MHLPAISMATPADRERTIGTILLGFASDPLVRWFWPEASTYLRSGEAFDAFGGGAIDAGAAYITENLEGAALWLPPRSSA